MCYADNSQNELARKDKEQMYQSIFNETLSKLRLVVSATGNEHLMKAVAKIMFDFSDCLKENNLLTDKEQKNDNKKQNN